MASSYAWVIDTDLIDGCDLGVVGPADASRAALEALEAGKGERFRLVDDDGEVYFVGRLVADADSDAAHPEGFDFAPLDDFGGPNAGCTAIEFARLAGAMVFDGRVVESFTWVRS